MTRVCVVGGGEAGRAAAREASALGAEVTLLESSPSFPSPRRVWASLIDGGPNPSPDPNSFSPETEVRLGECVARIRPGHVSLQRGGSIRPDAVVVATGASPLPPPFPGGTKSGVYVLRSPAVVRRLKTCLSSAERVVVTGAGVLPVEVADGLSRMGVGVTLLSRAHAFGVSLHRDVLQVLNAAAAARGVEVPMVPLQRVLGVDAVEAVLAGGKVIPCDALVHAPTFVPNTPPVAVPRGRLGGILVDARMRTSEKTLLSAGGCSEILDGGVGTTLLGDRHALGSGNTAGANAALASRSYTHSRSVSCILFGLRVVSEGWGPGDATEAGFDPVVAGRRTGRLSACAITFDRPSGRVLGVQAVAPPGELASAGVRSAVLTGASIRSLAEGLWESSIDISVVAETAREGMKSWSRF